VFVKTGSLREVLKYSIYWEIVFPSKIGNIFVFVSREVARHGLWGGGLMDFISFGRGLNAPYSKI